MCEATTHPDLHPGLRLEHRFFVDAFDEKHRHDLRVHLGLDFVGRVDQAGEIETCLFFDLEDGFQRHQNHEVITA